MVAARWVSGCREIRRGWFRWETLESLEAVGLDIFKILQVHEIFAGWWF